MQQYILNICEVKHIQYFPLYCYNNKSTVISVSVTVFLFDRHMHDMIGHTLSILVTNRKNSVIEHYSIVFSIMIHHLLVVVSEP